MQQEQFSGRASGPIHPNIQAGLKTHPKKPRAWHALHVVAAARKLGVGRVSPAQGL